MNLLNKIAYICLKYDIADLYVFGSRSKEIAAFLDNKSIFPSQSAIDLDIGILPADMEMWDSQKCVMLTVELEDLFQVDRVDLVLLPESDPYLAADIIRGELLYARNLDQQARYELFILRRAGDLLPFKKERTRMILEEGAR